MINENKIRNNFNGKKLIFFYFLVVFTSCNNTYDETFELYGHIKGDIPKIIYLNYGNTTDSSSVDNNQFYFKGKLKSPIRSDISIAPLSSMDQVFYVENNKMHIEIIVQKKEYKKMDINFIKLGQLKGSYTNNIYTDFRKYKERYLDERDGNKKLYQKLFQIVELLPKNNLVGDLIVDSIKDSILNTNQLMTLYDKLDKENQSNISIASIEKVIFPEKKMIKGNRIIPFQLPNENEIMISSNEFESSYLLIEFWASWCKPCRKKHPELKKIYRTFKDYDFEILGISLDAKRKQWIDALAKDDLPWVNLIDLKGFEGKVAADFELFYSIPHNFLVNQEGKIVARDITNSSLDKFLKETCKTK